MPLYTIRRELPDTTPEDIDAAAARAVMCAYEFEGLRWLRSYWDAERQAMLCVYEAAGPDQVRDHARRARIPCDEIREVEEVLPGPYING